MAVIVVFVNDEGQIVRLERQEDTTFAQKFARTTTAERILQRGVTYPEGQDFSDLHNLNDVNKGIDESPVITPENRREARRIFNEMKPGDRFFFTVEGVIISKAIDVFFKPLPLIIRFVDP